MNILYIAYSCDPYRGSEDKIGWNIPFEAYKKKNKVFIITKIEQKNSIERFLNNKKIKGIKVYYVDIPVLFKRVFKGPIYSGRLNIWNKKAYSLAKKLVKKYSISVIHQVTPVEFRAIGKYYCIKNVRFVLGPIGGGEYIPQPLKDYLTIKEKFFERIRSCLNFCYRLKFKIIKNKIDYIMYANNETCYYLNHNYKGHITTEIGVCPNEIKETKGKVENIFIVSGRLIYRKGHLLLFDALDKVNTDKKYEVRIIGSGPLEDKIKRIVNSNNNLKKHIIFLGQLSYEEALKEYSYCKAIILPSLRETTGTIILEATALGKPVVAYDGFGSAVVLKNEHNFLYKGDSKKEIIDSFSKKVLQVIEFEDYNDNSLKLLDDSRKYLFSNKYITYEKKAYKNKELIG